MSRQTLSDKDITDLKQFVDATFENCAPLTEKKTDVLECMHNVFGAIIESKRK